MNFAETNGVSQSATPYKDDLKQELKNSGGVQEHLSFEIVSTAGQIRFYVWVPKVLQSFVEGQIYSQYPSVQIYRMMFEGKLPGLPIVLSSGKTFLGACAYKKRKTLFGGTKYYDFKLRINKRIDLPEADIEDIIIHEMIHYHIAYRGIKDTSTHGRVFKMLMNDINKRFGRHITISRKMPYSVTTWKTI